MKVFNVILTSSGDGICSVHSFANKKVCKQYFAESKSALLNSFSELGLLFNITTNDKRRFYISTSIVEYGLEIITSELELERRNKI